jgi:hypothetical protein
MHSTAAVDDVECSMPSMRETLSSTIAQIPTAAPTRVRRRRVARATRISLTPPRPHESSHEPRTLDEVTSVPSERDF